MTDSAAIVVAIRDLREEISSLRDQLRIHNRPEPMLTTREAAQYAKVHEQQIIRWTKCGLPHYEIGKGFRIRKDELDQFLQNFIRGNQNER